MATTTLEQWQAVETAAKDVAAYIVKLEAIKDPKARVAFKVANGPGVKKELTDAIAATDADSGWPAEIFNTIAKAHGKYSRIMLNGSAGNTMTHGPANQLTDAEKAQAAAEEAQAAEVKGVRDADQSSLVSIVGRGVPIDADGTNPKHDAARRETARILEGYFALKFTDGPDNGKTMAQVMAKELGLKKGETTVDLVDDKGKLDRRKLDITLRTFQRIQGLESDGRIGSVTADTLLYFKDNANNSGYEPRTAQAAIFGKGGAYLCGKTRDCDKLQKYKDGDEKGEAGELKQAARDAVIQVRGLIEGLGVKVTTEANLKNLSEKEKAALKAFAAATKDDDNLTEGEIKAFQTAFGLKDDGIIGRETLATINQVNLRLAVREVHEVGGVIDPSQIKAAVQTQLGGHRPKGQQQK